MSKDPGSSDLSEKRRPDAWRSYLRSIRRYQVLTESGERRLGLEIESGSAAAREKLVEANLRLVIRIALEFRNRVARLEDLVAEGNLGLIQAAKRYDPKRGVRFASYATWWIRKYMLDALRRLKLDGAAGVAAAAETATPAPDGRSPAGVRRQRVLSFEDFMQHSSDRPLLERLVPTEVAEPETVALEHQLAEALRSVIHRLPAQERMVLEAHYGLAGDPPVTLQEIGLLVGLTRERVRQIELRALSRARRLLECGRGYRR